MTGDDCPWPKGVLYPVYLDALLQNTAMKNQMSHRAEVWRQYWSRDIAHSCGGSYADGYGQEATEFWNKAFTSMPLNGRVLDIGTGNGPLPRLLIELQSRSDLCCDAIDLADVTPTWLLALPEDQRNRVCFHGGRAAEQLPFPDHVFSAVVSQWGFEYSNFEASVREALRVLAPGGSIFLVLHHTDALPVILAHEELRHLDWLLAPNSYLNTLNVLLEPISRSGSAEGRASLMRDAAANALRARFQGLQDEILLRVGVSNCPDILQDAIQLTGELIARASQQGLPSARETLAVFEKELQHAQLRLSELVKHAMDESDVAVLGRSLGRGASYEVGLLKEQDHVMAWTLCVTPHAAYEAGMSANQPACP